jgi:hypothetical protein
MQPESIFRPEAIEHHQRGRGPGELIRLSPVWTTWAFWLLLMLFSGLIAASVLTTLGEDVEATAVIDRDGSVAALFPATYSDDLEVGGEMDLELEGVQSPVQVTIERIGPPIAPGSSEGLPGFAASLAAAQSQSSIPVEASLPDDVAEAGAESATGTAIVHIEDRLLFAIVPGLRNLLASND